MCRKCDRSISQQDAYFASLHPSIHPSILYPFSGPSRWSNSLHYPADPPLQTLQGRPRGVMPLYLEHNLRGPCHQGDFRPLQPRRYESPSWGPQAPLLHLSVGLRRSSTYSFYRSTWSWVEVTWFRPHYTQCCQCTASPSSDAGRGSNVALKSLCLEICLT